MSGLMSADAFWAHIQQSQPFGEGQAERLSAALDALSCEEKQGFSLAFRQHVEDAYRWDIWGAAYLYGGGCSDDSFSDFRAGVIALGRTVFEAVLSDPDQLASRVKSLPEGTELFAEEFGHVHFRPFMEGKCSLPDGKIEPNAHPFSAHLEGNDWDFDDEDEMRRRYPDLWEITQEAM